MLIVTFTMFADSTTVESRCSLWAHSCRGKNFLETKEILSSKKSNHNPSRQALLRLLLSPSTKDNLPYRRHRARLLLNCDVALGQILNTSTSAHSRWRLHGLRTFGRHSGVSLHLHGGLVQWLESCEHRLAGTDGTFIYSWRNVLCAAHSRTLVPGQVWLVGELLLLVQEIVIVSCNATKNR